MVDKKQCVYRIQFSHDVKFVPISIIILVSIITTMIAVQCVFYRIYVVVLPVIWLLSLNDVGYDRHRYKISSYRSNTIQYVAI